MTNDEIRKHGRSVDHFAHRHSFVIRYLDFGFRIFAIALCCAGCSTTQQSGSNANLLPALRPYVKEVVAELGTIGAERKAVLGEIANNIAGQLQAGKTAQLTFICTHNSRRSHMSQAWAQT